LIFKLIVESPKNKEKFTESEHIFNKFSMMMHGGVMGREKCQKWLKIAQNG